MIEHRCLILFPAWNYINLLSLNNIRGQSVSNILHARLLKEERLIYEYE